MFKEAIKRIDSAGNHKNIQRWSAWTPKQLSLMEMSHLLKRVIIIGGSGTGKTTILDAFANKTATEERNGNVIFAIHQGFHTKSKPLLELELLGKFRRMGLKHIIVKTFHKFNQLMNDKTLNLVNSTLCIDEIDMEDITANELNQIQAKNLWVVIREPNIEKGEDPEDYIRKQFPGWEVVHLTYPLRTSMRISEQVKTSHIARGLLNNVFNGKLDLAPNMPLGPEPLRFESGSYQERLEKAFRLIDQNQSALIILDFRSMEPKTEDFNRAKCTADYKNLLEKGDKWSIFYLVGLEALKACNRPLKPLVWFQSDYQFLSSAKSEIIEHMKDKKNNRRELTLYRLKWL